MARARPRAYNAQVRLPTAATPPLDLFRSVRRHSVGLPTAPLTRSSRAYRMLLVALIALLIMAGAGMLSGTLAPWESYVAPILLVSPLGPDLMVKIAGALCVLVGFLLVVNPPAGAVAAEMWLGLAALDFLFLPGRQAMALGLMTLSAASAALSELAAARSRRR